MRSRPRPIGRPDAALLAIAAALCLASAVVVDREQSARRRASGAGELESIRRTVNRPDSTLPLAIRGLWQPSIRLDAALQAALLPAGPVLALVAYRPRRGHPRGRSGPGHVASLIASGLVAIFAVSTVLGRRLEPLIVLPPGTTRGTPVGPPMAWLSFVWTVGNFLPWTILGAWGYLALTHQWTPPIDLADRLGRWLGWLWLGQVVLKGFIILSWRI